VSASSRRYNETSSKAPLKTKAGPTKISKKRVVKLSTNNLVDSSTKVLIDLDDLHQVKAGSHYAHGAMPQTTTAANEAHAI